VIALAGVNVRRFFQCFDEAQGSYEGFACGCLVVVLVGLKGLFVVLSLGFLRVSLAGFSLFFLFFFLLVIILYTSRVL
jgi:hypothetical protein